jgi:hypothetical protein
MAIVRIDGREMEIDDEIAKSDEKLRAVFTMYHAAYANADIQRKEETGQLIVTVIKRAGPKGVGIMDNVVNALKETPEYLNPALQMRYELEELGSKGEIAVEIRLSMHKKIEEAKMIGEKQLNLISSSVKSLMAASPIPSINVPEGF